MISRTLALKLFEGFFIQRWNDRIRPVDLTEMDKNAHKAFLTYFIAKEEESVNGSHLDWTYLINGLVFAFLKNIVLSDIKSSVHRRIRDSHPDEFEKLNRWVIEQYGVLIDNNDLLDDFKNFLFDDPGDKKEFRILRAAHKLSTQREFKIIEHANGSNPNLEKLDRQLLKDLTDFTDLSFVNQYNLKQEVFDLFCIIEQLRFQLRWSQTPRIPPTSVLGHSFLVACLGFFIARNGNYQPGRTYNLFWGSLFHDIPESVTRDIVSPIKNITPTLRAAISKVEKEICEAELYPLIPEHCREEIHYFTADSSENLDEFKNRIMENGVARPLGENEDINNFDDSFRPLDGVIVKFCDEIAAFLEAQQSIEIGIATKHIRQGYWSILSKYEDQDIVQKFQKQYNIDVRRFFRSF